MTFEAFLISVGWLSDFHKVATEAFTLQLKLLLETKHLYRRVSVDLSGTISAFRGDRTPAQAGDPEAALRWLAKQQWTLVDEANIRSVSGTDLLLILRHVKIFCANCRSREAFRPMWFYDITGAALAKVSAGALNDWQLFAFAYYCQRCLSAPVGFLVRREKNHLILEGRSPFEEVEVPAFVPKPERRFYRDALIALHAGKTLAALLYLRTFIEQYARRRCAPSSLQRYLTNAASQQHAIPR